MKAPAWSPVSTQAFLWYSNSCAKDLYRLPGCAWLLHSPDRESGRGENLAVELRFDIDEAPALHDFFR